MRVTDVMTRDVGTVTPESTLTELVRLLAGRHVSGAPVVNAERQVVGIVTEGDLVRRYEIGTDRKRRSWLQGFFDTSQAHARDFVRTHSRCVADIMTREVISVGESATLADVAEIFEERRIRRVPVMLDGKLVGIVSRADLIRALDDRLADELRATGDDREISERFQKVLETEPWADVDLIHFSVKNGVIELWGLVPSEEQHQALLVAAESTPGVRRIEDRLTIRPPFIAA
jgi:CBS domain-containing protein